jgi:hypothetical protein
MCASNVIVIFCLLAGACSGVRGLSRGAITVCPVSADLRGCGLLMCMSFLLGFVMMADGVEVVGVDGGESGRITGGPLF